MVSGAVVELCPFRKIAFDSNKQTSENNPYKKFNKKQYQTLPVLTVEVVVVEVVDVVVYPIE